MSLLALTLQQKAQAEIQAGQKAFLGFPDRWFDKPHWRCENEHVSTTFLKSELHGSLCLACRKPVHLTFPEDVDGPLR